MLLVSALWAAVPGTLHAEEPTAPASAPAPAPAPPAPRTVTCASTAGARQHCAADTAAGVAMQRTTGNAACLLGRTWGYDAQGVWVQDGCSGEFVLGRTSPAASEAQPQQAAAQQTAGQTQAQSETGEYTPIETWGVFEPGKGVLVGKGSFGEVSLSAYALVRYLNQLPAGQTFVDHLGNEHEVDPRHDIYSHRVMVFLKGWMGLPRLRYQIIFWTVNTTDQKAIFANLGYQFCDQFSLYAGLNALPGTRTLQGSHPYWLGNDRVMADEFFRPYFTNGVWASGAVLPGLWYTAMLGNNLSALGITARQLTRDFSTSASIWWMPTTTEFGPQGAFGDWESHDQVATRFGVSATRSREDRFANVATGGPDNTTLRLPDSLNLFDEGSLAPDVTVQLADYRMVAFDAGAKFRGIFLQAEYYNRWLDDFDTDGPVPVSSIHDTGFYVQAAFYPLPKKLELYAATSQIFGDEDAGFGRSYEYLGGLNFYFADTRNHRLNLQVIRVERSPVSSSFGYYVGGQRGTTVTAAATIFF